MDFDQSTISEYLTTERLGKFLGGAMAGAWLVWSRARTGATRAWVAQDKSMGPVAPVAIPPEPPAEVLARLTALEEAMEQWALEECRGRLRVLEVAEKELRLELDDANADNLRLSMTAANVNLQLEAATVARDAAEKRAQAMAEELDALKRSLASPPPQDAA